MMAVELLYFIVYWLNKFLTKNRGSDTISPCRVLRRIILDFDKNCRLSFGSCVQIQEKEPLRNSVVARTMEAVTFGPDKSQQGADCFINLNNGKKVYRKFEQPCSCVMKQS